MFVSNYFALYVLDQCIINKMNTKNENKQTKNMAKCFPKEMWLQSEGRWRWLKTLALLQTCHCPWHIRQSSNTSFPCSPFSYTLPVSSPHPIPLDSITLSSPPSSTALHLSLPHLHFLTCTSSLLLLPSCPLSFLSFLPFHYSLIYHLNSSTLYTEATTGWPC